MDKFEKAGLEAIKCLEAALPHLQQANQILKDLFGVESPHDFDRWALMDEHEANRHQLDAHRIWQNAWTAQLHCSDYYGS